MLSRVGSIDQKTAYHESVAAPVSHSGAEGRRPLRHAEVAEFVEALSRAATFEEAAGLCLRGLLQAASEALEHSRYRGQGSIRRAIAHLRPDDGYRGLVVLESGADSVAHARGEEFLISTRAWRTIAKRNRALAIDVEMETLLPVEAEGGPARFESTSDPVETSAGGHTLTRLQRRGATHLYVLPLRGLGGPPAGMLSVEAECPKATGERFIWQELHATASLVADIAAPYLVQLPAERAEAAEADSYLPVVGVSMAPLVRVLRVFAQQEETLLLSGPTGTGKSRMARWCHHQSPRSAGPFETVDLLSLPEDVQMGELFGWRKGSFTGATGDHPGFVTRAQGGTLFIDEIDKLSPRAQAGLLYLIEERRYRALGDDRERESDLRFIVGTNANLRGEVAAGRFREDLYYRINVLAVSLPPLEERRDEIADWARYMLERRRLELGRPGTVELAQGAAKLLASVAWPGNLRQLDNVVRRACVLALAEGATGSESPRTLSIEESHVRSSLLAEGTPGSGIRSNLLHEVAAEFVAEALRRGRGLDLDLLTGLRGLALAEAIRQTGSPEAAFTLLGRESLVRGRNHHKALQRELGRAADLCRALGFPEALQDEEERP